MIGEGSKIDNLVQIGHNTRLGRHDMIVGQVGISGSCELGDFVVLGGQVGIADHTKIGDGARMAARGADAVRRRTRRRAGLWRRARQAGARMDPRNSRIDEPGKEAET